MKKGFTLIELLIVMSVVAILVSIIIPSLRGLQQEAWITQAETETGTLQIAIVSYRRHHNSYPANIVSDLQNTKPAIVTKVLKDPWKTTGVPYNTYQYVTGNTTAGEAYFIVYSNGLNSTGNYTLVNEQVLIPQGMVAKSNLPVIQE